jgi:hypothetical protein
MVIVAIFMWSCYTRFGWQRKGDLFLFFYVTQYKYRYSYIYEYLPYKYTHIHPIFMNTSERLDDLNIKIYENGQIAYRCRHERQLSLKE